MPEVLPRPVSSPRSFAPPVPPAPPPVDEELDEPEWFSHEYREPAATPVPGVAARDAIHGIVEACGSAIRGVVAGMNNAELLTTMAEVATSKPHVSPTSARAPQQPQAPQEPQAWGDSSQWWSQTEWEERAHSVQEPHSTPWADWEERAATEGAVPSWVAGAEGAGPLPTVDEELVYKTPPLFVSPGGHLVNAMGEKVDRFGRLTRPRGVKGANSSRRGWRDDWRDRGAAWPQWSQAAAGPQAAAAAAQPQRQPPAPQAAAAAAQPQWQPPAPQAAAAAAQPQWQPPAPQAAAAAAQPQAQPFSRWRWDTEV